MKDWITNPCNFGIYGDFLYGWGHTRYGSGPIESLAGPTIGPLIELGVTQPLDAISKLIQGKESHFWARELQDIKGFIPFQNVWYAKAAMEHLVWQQALEALSPGYLRSMRKRVQKEFNQEFWWKPGELLPERGPDFGVALEE